MINPVYALSAKCVITCQLGGDPVRGIIHLITASTLDHFLKSSHSPITKLIFRRTRSFHWSWMHWRAIFAYDWRHWRGPIER
jgi:hypothetical protein